MLEFDSALNNMSLSWLSRGSFGRNGSFFTGFFISFSFNFIIISISLEKSCFDIGFSYMFQSYVKLLLDFSSVDLFPHKNSDGSWVDVEYLTGSSVIESVRHSLVLGTINHDIDIVSNFVLL